MNINVIKNEKDSILIEIKGESVAFVNLLKEELWKNANVVEAAAIKDHPYMGQPKLLVKVSKGSPMTAIKEAIKGLQKEIKELSSEFDRDIKE